MITSAYHTHMARAGDLYLAMPGCDGGTAATSGAAATSVEVPKSNNSRIYQAELLLFDPRGDLYKQKKQ